MRRFRRIRLRSTDHRSFWPLLTIFFGVAAFFYWLYIPASSNTFSSSNPNKNDVCPLPPIPNPIDDGLDNSVLFERDSSLKLQVQRLSAAVNIATVIYDDNGLVKDDAQWKIFSQFHDLLEKLFPLVHQHATREKINTYGLVYTFNGNQPLKPVVFMAHQDVVPAGNPAKWTNPPFEGYFDGQFLWGRGSGCKNNLIGVLSAVEALLKQGWSPRRTVLLAFGFDEEIGGKQGSRHIAIHLENRYGPDGIAMIMDEGGAGIDTLGDTAYARPAITEKGYVDIILRIVGRGGHSSRPPLHSSIGIMSEAIIELEKYPFNPRLTMDNPLRQVLQCQLKYSSNDVEPWLRRSLKGDEGLMGIRLAEARGSDFRFSMQTSQAIDVISGGEKSNQLPDEVSVIVNYRVPPHDSIINIKARVARLIEPVARKHNLAIRGFGFEGEPTEKGIFVLESRHDLQPAPISPTGQSDVWLLFAGTIRKVFEDSKHLHGKTVVPVGDIMSGEYFHGSQIKANRSANTDTVHYWNLTRNIYRFTPARSGTLLGTHTIDERIDISAHLEGIRVYYDLIRNFDQS